ncbi:beta-propeller fold lactonase family protein [Nocardia sp. CA2R105]|uniref:lactonase family protein n=1 Tax=Nocardia coffeae TaxID=2873381 RepID=UPI001CA60F28|nr:beta-propeller fold lactonase family protein [Nocardia coffeae]MBY8857911.1 beta-propeller fold lactonase family protein [Nocardia coffeae]
MSGDSASTIVYVSNAGSAEISVLRLEDDGALKPVQTVDTAGAVMPLTTGPGHRHLYASLRSEPYSVVCYEIDSGTGELTEQARVRLPDNMAYLSTDRHGRFLFAASYSGNVVSVNPIGPDGIVGSEPSVVLATPPHAHSVVVDPSNRYLFAASLGGDVLLQYLFDQVTGVPILNVPPRVPTLPGAGPRHLVFHPDGRWVYVANELDGTVGGYEFDTGTGCLTPIGTYSAIPEECAEPWAAEVRLTPDGRYLYVSERRSSTLAGFRVAADTGALEPLGHTATETCPRGFDIDPSGRYLLAAGQESDALTVHAIDPDTGALTICGRQELGRDPNWVEIVELR